jgi:hypothetical protein
MPLTRIIEYLSTALGVRLKLNDYFGYPRAPGQALVT